MTNKFFHCGDVIREKDGRHEYRIDMIEGAQLRSGILPFIIHATCLTNGWRRVFNLEVEEIERADNGRQYLLEGE
jgi:hypothetical protein